MIEVLDRPVAIPNKRGGIPKYPWGALKVGESFFVAVADSDPLRVESNLSTCGIKWTQYKENRAHIRFTVRLVTEDGVQGVRVWRVA